jgi:hypothetical protein
MPSGRSGPVAASSKIPLSGASANSISVKYTEYRRLACIGVSVRAVKRVKRAKRVERVKRVERARRVARGVRRAREEDSAKAVKMR